MLKAPDPKEVLSERKLLIADLDPVHRAFLTRLAGDLGFAPGNVRTAKDAAEALQLVTEEEISTILYDDSVGIATLEKIQAVLATRPGENVFMFLVSENSSQAGVGRAVEAEVDGFCLKPFSGDEFKVEFMASFVEKIAPDEFRKVLNLGKARLYVGDLEQAEKLFEKAKDLGPAPSSAHFYAGQVKLMKQLLEESGHEFMQGLLLNQIHFKCLKAMFDLLHGQEKIEESYEVLRRLVGVFPENGERLKLAIRMAIKTGNFFDISTWFEVYEGQPEPSEEAKKHVCAALSIFGRYLLMREKADEAMKAFDRALTIAIRKEVFLTYAVESLQKYGLGEEATRLVKAHDPEFAEALAGTAGPAAA